MIHIPPWNSASLPQSGLGRALSISNIPELEWPPNPSGFLSAATLTTSHLSSLSGGISALLLTPAGQTQHKFQQKRCCPLVLCQKHSWSSTAGGRRQILVFYVAELGWAVTKQGTSILTVTQSSPLIWDLMATSVTCSHQGTWKLFWKGNQCWGLLWFLQNNQKHQWHGGGRGIHSKLTITAVAWWHEVKEMSQCRQLMFEKILIMFCPGEMIYAIRMFPSANLSPSIQVFQPSSLSWSTLNAKFIAMIKSPGSSCSVVFFFLPQIEDWRQQNNFTAQS